MEVQWNRIGHTALLAAGFFLVGGCALDVKVRENWGQAKDSPIPLDDAAITWQQLQSGAMPSRDRVKSYNDAVRRSVVQLAENWNSNLPSVSRIKTTSGLREIAVDSINLRNIELIDQLIPAHYIRVKRGFEDHVHVEGVGEPLMVRQRWTESDSMIPGTGLWYPVTGVLNLDQPDRPVLELIDPTRKNAMIYHGGRFPLSVDYTATIARDFHDRQRQFLDLPALFQFEKYAERMGMYRVSAFDPDKQACILVHGLYSGPVTWNHFLNQAQEDREIRERYEFWTFGYPTGAPIPYLAEEFRKAVRDLQAFREANGASRIDLVVVGHSMGGLLAKAATQRGTDEDWNKLFKVPIEQLEVSEEDREILRAMVYNEPISDIKRVVFCATPHKGSKIASHPGAKVVGDLIQLPKSLVEVTNEIVKKSRDALTPLGMELAKKPSSIDQLRPSSHVTAEYLNKPLNPAVKYHSVIGRKRPNIPLEKSSDSVVFYKSSHIEGVVSEKVIDRSPHGVHREHGGIEEIVRILKLP